MRACLIAGASLAIALGGCSGAEEAPKPQEQKAEALQPGEYEITATVDEVRSTDNSSPAALVKAGSAPKMSRTCIGQDNAIAENAFLEGGESCTAGETYISGGRMSLQYRCSRSGKGQLSHLVDGKFQADSFEGKVITTTIFSGPGDYELTRSITARRVGECAAKAG